MAQLRQVWLFLGSCAVAACGGGGGDNNSMSGDPATAQRNFENSACNAPLATEVSTGSITASGAISFAHVPHNTRTNGLNYANTTDKSVRGATVEFRNSNGIVLASGKTDELGNYQLKVPNHTPMCMVVRAELLRNDVAARWDVKVRNPDNNGVHAFVFNGFDSGSENFNKNYHLSSGWVGDNSSGSYAKPRASGPFAILDSIYDALVMAEKADPKFVIFPPLKVYWKAGYVPSPPTSFYSSADVSIHILGDENADTDEFDGHVVAHEWAHYFEDQLSRSDSIGGAHNGADHLDIRVALGEGFGNAVSALATNDRYYRDSHSANQQRGFRIDVEANDATGWYNESTVMGLIYDIADSNNEFGDFVSGDFSDLYRAMTSPAYRNQASYTSIFSLLNHIKLNAHSDTFEFTLDNMADERGLDSSNVNDFGSNETNNAGHHYDVLPVYKPLTVNAGATEMCTSNKFGGATNKLAYRRFAHFSLANGSRTTLTAKRTSGDETIMLLRRNGTLLDAYQSSSTTLNRTHNLLAGDYVLELYNTRMTGLNSRSCYEVSVRQ